MKRSGRFSMLRRLLTGAPPSETPEWWVDFLEWMVNTPDSPSVFRAVADIERKAAVPALRDDLRDRCGDSAPELRDIIETGMRASPLSREEFLHAIEDFVRVGLEDEDIPS